MSKKQRPQTSLISWRDTLTAMAVHNAAADVARDDKGHITVSVRKNRPWFLFWPITWIIKPCLKQNIVLDGLGTRLWELCDGRKDVEALVDEFASAYRLTFHESRVAVTSYIKQLVQRGAMALVKQESN